MFSPKYSITNKILSNVVSVELDLFYVKSVDIPVEWTKRLRAESLVRRISGGLRLVDMPISTDVVSRVVADEPDRDEKTIDIANRLGLMVKERDLQMTLNLINTNKLVDQISYISSKFIAEKVSLKEMSQINRLVRERMIVTENAGGFRVSDINGADSFLFHPRFNEVPYQMDEFMSWFENSGNGQVHPIIKFAIVFGELLRISPFNNYNVITTLFFSLAFLGSVGYEVLYLSIEEEIAKTQIRLKEVIADYERTNWDLTGVIDYFVGILQTSASKLKIRVSSIEGTSIKYRSGVGKAVALSERQLAIMEEITVKGEMTIKQIREILPLVSDDTILRDIKDLIGKKMIRKRGKTKGAVYILGKTKNL